MNAETYKEVQELGRMTVGELPTTRSSYANASPGDCSLWPKAIFPNEPAAGPKN